MDAPEPTTQHDSRQASPDNGGSDSNDDDDDAQTAETTTTRAASKQSRKRKRRERACDHCRLRKVKCNGFESEDRVCSLCRKSGINCAYVMNSKKRNNPPRPSAATSSSVPKAERGASVDRDLDEDETARASILVFRPHSVAGRPDEPTASPAPVSPTRQPMPSRMYMGKSSTLSFTQDAGRLARKANGHPPPRAFPPPHDPNSACPQPQQHGFGSSPPWEVPDYADKLSETDVFPPTDLALALLNYFFRRLHPVLPLFCETSLRKRFTRRDYASDSGFNNLCLMIFALTSSHGFNDTRCWAPENPLDPSSASYGIHSSGWIFYHQSARLPRPRLKPAGLLDMQISVLTAVFLGHSSNPTVGWTITGEGVTFAKELGAHRGGLPLNPDADEVDLLRRSFWCLLLLDAELSAATGRPPHIALGSYDAPLPALEVNDVVDPDMAAFSLLVGAAELLRKSVETMYSIANATRSRAWVLQQMALLTAEIDAFQFALPPDLRWTASQADDRLYNQATSIQLLVNSAKIYVTRSSLPSPQSPGTPSISTSFCEVCVSSALKIAVVLETQTQRSGPGLPLLSPALQTAASVIAIVLFGGTAAGLVTDEPALEEGLKRCLRVTKASQELWLTSAMRAGWITSLIVLRNAGVGPAVVTQQQPPPAAMPPPPMPPSTLGATTPAWDSTAASLLALAQQSSSSTAPTTDHAQVASAGYPYHVVDVAHAPSSTADLFNLQVDGNDSSVFFDATYGAARDLDFAWEFMNAASGFS